MLQCRKTREASPLFSGIPGGAAGGAGAGTDTLNWTKVVILFHEDSPNPEFHSCECSPCKEHSPGPPGGEEGAAAVAGTETN